MYSTDQTLIGPRRGEIEAAMYEAVDAIHRDLALDLHGDPIWQIARLDACARGELERLWNQMEPSLSGQHEWRTPAWRYPSRAALLVVWWTDYLSRRHVRIVGGCARQDVILPTPAPTQPPLACIYPAPCVIESRHRHYRLLTLCACGAWGAPEQLAWMGPCCGPCFDRDVNEPVRSLGWRTGSDAAIDRLAVAPDGERLATLDGRGQVQLRRIIDGELLETWSISRGQAKLAFSSDGGRLAAGCAWPASMVIHSGDEVWGDTTFPFAFTADGRGLIVNDQAQGLVLVDARSRRLVRGFLGPRATHPTDLALSPDGRRLAAANDAELMFWDLFTGEQRGRIPLGTCLPPLAFSPDSTTIAVRVRAGHPYVALHDLMHPTDRHALIGSSEIHDFAFSPDGSLIVTVEQDTVRVWDAMTTLELRNLSPCDMPREALRSVAFTPDGQLLALGTATGAVRFWPVEMLRAG